MRPPGDQHEQVMGQWEAEDIGLTRLCCPSWSLNRKLLKGSVSVCLTGLAPLGEAMEEEVDRKRNE